MPMKKGCSRETVHENIRREIHKGHKHKQAVAMALSQCDRSHSKRDKKNDGRK